MQIRELRYLLDHKIIGAEELLEAYFIRIKKKQELNCYITLCEETARKQARSAQERIDRQRAGFLTGIPISVKDNICTKDIRTTCASKMLADFVPSYDAFAVEQLKKQGAVLIGKTNMDEFAMGNTAQTSYFGGVCNPYDNRYVAGGSSGGAAAAVAAGLCAAALGSDTGGSVRQPSAFCGVTGIKPTYSRISRFGLIAFASSLDQIGAIAGSAYDAAMLLQAVAGPDDKDASMSRREADDFSRFCGKDEIKRVIGIPRELFEDSNLDGAVGKCVLQAAERFRKAGCVLKTCSIPSIKYAVGVYYLLSSAEAASNLGRFDGVRYGHCHADAESYEELVVRSRSEGFGNEVKRRILLGNYALSRENQKAYYQKALMVREQIRKECLMALEGCDMLLMPTAPKTACLINSQIQDPAGMYAADRYTVLANLAGLPAVSTVCGYDKHGLPIGMSLMGSSFEEAVILGAADWFERRFLRKEAVIWQDICR